MNDVSNLLVNLRPARAPAFATPGARVYTLLPELPALFGVPAFGRRPILVDGQAAPHWTVSLFGARPARSLLN